MADLSSGVIDTVNPDGSALRQVTTPDEGFAMQPAWTPDASHLVVAAVTGEGRGQDLRGGRRRLGLAPSGPRPAGLVRLRADGDPRRQPGLLQPLPAGPAGGCAIAAANMDGTGRHLVTSYSPRRVDVNQFFCAISPDGSHLAYGQTGQNGYADQVIISNLDGSDAHPVTAPALEAIPSDWTADGSSVLVTSAWNHFGEEVFAQPVDGGTPQELASDSYPGSAYLPTDSPSGESLAYISDQGVPYQQGFLYVANADGSGQHLVDIGSDMVNYPQWGTAPLLPASAATPTGRLAPAASATTLRHLRSVLPPGMLVQATTPGSRPGGAESDLRAVGSVIAPLTRLPS